MTVTLGTPVTKGFCPPLLPRTFLRFQRSPHDCLLGAGHVAQVIPCVSVTVPVDIIVSMTRVSRDRDPVTVWRAVSVAAID
jgi:hypothetical protein